jgi:anti-sigma regulatory factor (Ser/Thr protein kinase)
LARTAESAGAVARDTIDGFVTAAHEVLVNALEHGGAPVQLVLWVDTARLACRITDQGPGITDTLAGFRPPAATGHAGLWVARQLCEDVILSNNPRGGGGSVLLATA